MLKAKGHRTSIIGASVWVSRGNPAPRRSSTNYANRTTDNMAATVSRVLWERRRREATQIPESVKAELLSHCERNPRP